MRNDSGNGRPATIRDIAEAIKNFRWEMRFWIVMTLLASKFVPVPKEVKDVASTIIGWW